MDNAREELRDLISIRDYPIELALCEIIDALLENDKLKTEIRKNIRGKKK